MRDWLTAKLLAKPAPTVKCGFQQFCQSIRIFRLYGWKYDPLSLKRPQFIGKFTKEFVYNEMSPEILKELEIKNPTLENGRRRRKHHQHLTEEIGVPHLERHLTKLVTVMQLSDSIDDFRDNFNRAFRRTNQLKFDMTSEN